MTGEERDTGMTVVIVEDDDAISDLIAEEVLGDCYRIRQARSLADAFSAVNEGPVDLIILDLTLPDGDGVDFCRQVRARGFSGGIIMVSARVAPIDRVLGLEIGADDYLIKPFEPRELRVRVRNLIRLTHQGGDAGKPQQRVARFGQWQLDLQHRRLIAPDGGLVMLSSAEYRLMRHFLESPDCVLARKDLAPQRSATAAYDRSIDVQISRLRQKLVANGRTEEVILTVRSEGYVLPGPVTFE